MKYTQKGEKCDEAIMEAGIAAIEWRSSHVCILSDISLRF